MESSSQPYVQITIKDVNIYFPCSPTVALRFVDYLMAVDSHQTDQHAKVLLDLKDREHKDTHFDVNSYLRDLYGLPMVEREPFGSITRPAANE